MKTHPLNNLDEGRLGQELSTIFDRTQRAYMSYAVTNSYTFTDRDDIDSLQVDATAGNLVVVLPAPTGSRRRRVIKTDATGNTVTIVGTINGATNHVLTTQFEFIKVEPTGTGWLIIGY